MTKAHFLNRFEHPLCEIKNWKEGTGAPSQVTCLNCLKIMDAPGDPWGIHERFKQFQEALP